MPVERVVVEVDLGVERDHLAVVGEDERVDLGDGAVGLLVRLVERHDELDGLLERRPLEAEAEGDLARLVGAEPRRRVDVDLDDLLGRGLGHLLDLDAALGGGHDDVHAGRAVERHADVVLVRDVLGCRHEHLADELPLGAGLRRVELHAEDLLGRGPHVVDGGAELDAAAFAAPARVDLRLDDELRDAVGGHRLGGLDGLFDRVGDDAALDGDAVLVEDFFGLILVDLHREGGLGEEVAASYPRQRRVGWRVRKERGSGQWAVGSGQWAVGSGQWNLLGLWRDVKPPEAGVYRRPPRQRPTFCHWPDPTGPIPLALNARGARRRLSGTSLGPPPPR